MLIKSIFNIHIKKIIYILIMILTLFSIFTLFTTKKVQAAYSSKFANYPGYEELIKKLQEAHPNWEFEILETGLDWSEVIIAESTGHHGINVVPQSWSDGWKCSCGKKVDETWVCASTAAVAYYMDPRNSLNEDYVFQFEHLSYDEKNQTREGVEKILSPCDYMQGKVTYYDANGNKKTLDKTYVDIIMEAAKEYNVSPYHLASRIRQEQGTGSAGSLVSGTWTGENGKYKGLYNYFNVKAFGSTTYDIIKNGLTYAKNKGWTDPEKAIKGGAEVLASGYISCGQDTLYLEKFDVIDGGDGYYAYQYMTNVSASKTEGSTIRDTYEEMGMLSKDSKIKFKIPVYKNMSEQISTQPGSEKVVTQDVEITEKDVRVRSGKGTNYTTITYLNKGDKILRIELDNSKDASGIYWDKVVLPDGTKGYVSREYLKEIDIQSNCSEQYVVSAYTNFRNGPGTTQTTIIKLLSPGQIITVVEKDKYKNINGEDWYRVKLSDGTYGYVGTGYIKKYEETQVEMVKVVCTDGINIRKEPSTSSAVLKAVVAGTVLTRIEKDVQSTDTTYTWDKITTSSGIVGYVVREDPNTKKAWIEPIDNIDDGNDENTGTAEIKGEGFKTSGNYIICEPNITVTKIKTVSEEIVIKKAETTLKDTDNVGTGNTLTFGGKTYTIVVLGDVNGDGKVNTGDTLAMSQHIENFKKITNTEYLKAADANEDGKVNTGDSLKIRQHVENFKKITI